MNIVLCIFAHVKVECTSNVASRWSRHLSLSQGGWSDQSWSYTIDSFCPLKDNFTPMFECDGCGMFFREEPSHTKPKVVTLTTVNFNLIGCMSILACGQVIPGAYYISLDTHISLNRVVLILAEGFNSYMCRRGWVELWGFRIDH
jgi:hypothetical protein